MKSDNEIPIAQPLQQLYAALASAQGEFLPIEKNKEASITPRDSSKRAYTFKYADLNEITSKTRPALSKHGLCITQPIRQSGQKLTLVTILAHSGGGVLQAEIDIPTGGSDIKQLGATISFLRRYAKSAMLDIAADDDLDDNSDEPDDARARNVPANDNKPPFEPDAYSQEKFNENLPNWRAVIQGRKKTAAQLIAFVESKGSPLTQAQRQTLEAIKPTEPTE